MTNKEWLSTLSADEWWNFVHGWLFREFSRQWTDSKTAITDWLEKEHVGTVDLEKEYIKFIGAAAHDGADGREYTPRGVIWIRKEAIIAYYDHTILLQGHKIRVMETLEEIQKKVRE